MTGVRAFRDFLFSLLPMNQLDFDFNGGSEYAATVAHGHSRFSPLSLEAKARDLLRGIGCDALAGKVRVIFNTRMTSTAGTANHAKSLITLNPRITEFGEAEVDTTLRHELAHLVARERCARRRIAPHGSEWRAACALLGIAGESRCHTLPLPRRVVARRHLYRCGGCGEEIRRTRPFRRRVACLACCRAHNRGHYDERFRLVKIRP
jgi:predicted SprT family Zn-dependent metalloprotease